MQTGPVDNDLCVFRPIIQLHRPMWTGPVDNDLCVLRPIAHLHRLMQTGSVDDDLCVFSPLWPTLLTKTSAFSDLCGLALLTVTCVLSDPLHTYLGLCGPALLLMTCVFSDLCGLALLTLTCVFSDPLHTYLLHIQANVGWPCWQ